MAVKTAADEIGFANTGRSVVGERMERTIRFELDVPAQNLNHLLSEADRDGILAVFNKYKLDEVYIPEKEIVISCRNVVEKDADVHSGHKLWKQRHPAHLNTPNGLPRLEGNAAAGGRLHQVSVEYVDRHSPGFFSCYGYIGYYLSVIADLEKKTIVDARGEMASE
jgi:hypothetical protein